MDPPRYENLRALYLNCTLKPSPETSNTEGLIDRSTAVMRAAGVHTRVIRPVDRDLAVGVQPDMTEHGAASDAWPDLYATVMAADILVLCGPIWLGDNSSVMKHVIERLYSNSAELNEAGQSAYYGGRRLSHHGQRRRPQALRHEHPLQPPAHRLRHPPQADAGWIGEAGPGPSYLDADSGGPENDFTNRNTTFAAWNLMHLAALLKRAGGIPAYGNQRPAWNAGCRFDAPNPEHRS